MTNLSYSKNPNINEIYFAKIKKPLSNILTSNKLIPIILNRVQDISSTFPLKFNDKNHDVLTGSHFCME